MWMVSFLDNETGNRNIRMFSDSEFEIAKKYSMLLINDKEKGLNVSHVQLCAVHECLVSNDIQTDRDRTLRVNAEYVGFKNYVDE